MAHVLIIDDDRALRSMLRRVLEMAGHRVQEAEDGFQGIRRHREQPADVILCDLFMPEKEGLETIRELQSADSGVKIIAMSGGCPHAPMDFLPLAAQFGAVKTLYKPFELNQVLDAVNEVVSLSPSPLPRVC
jgi:DNA-binding NtrC family response regulator